MSTVPKQLLTSAQYLARERSAEFRSEFFNGEMFAMAGVNRRHSLICTNLLAWLHPRLRPCGCEVHGSDMRVKVSRTGLYTYPDVSIACGEVAFEDEHEDVLLNPRVIFEVLSKSTEGRDRGWKFKQYRRIPSLLEYVLLAQDRPSIERFARPPGGNFELTEHDGLEAALTLSSVSLQLPLSEIYRDVVAGDEEEMRTDGGEPQI